MNSFLNLFAFAALVAIVALIAILRIGIGTLSIRGKMKHAHPAPWDLQEFLSLNPSSPKRNEFYRFSEESVRSHAHRFVGRFDGAILHWEEVPILDMIIENKFPVSYLPERAKKGDIFQASLYALALAETGVSCSDTRLVMIYCLQDVARRCLEGNSPKLCGDCGEGKIFSMKFNRSEIERNLARIDKVWYGKSRPKPNPTEENCRPCPYSKSGKCNYSAV